MLTTLWLPSCTHQLQAPHPISQVYILCCNHLRDRPVHCISKERSVLCIHTFFTYVRIYMYVCMYIMYVAAGVFVRLGIGTSHNCIRCKPIVVLCTQPYLPIY